MRLETIQYSASDGWSGGELPALDSDRTLVLVFGGSGFADDAEPIRELKRFYRQAALVGCSSSGEIWGDQIRDDTLSVAIAKFDDTRVAVASASVGCAADSRGAGETLGRALAGAELRGVFVLSDGLNVNGSELVEGLGAELPAGTVVTGGLAGDGDRFQRTWVVRDGEPASGAVVAVGLYGTKVHIHHGSRGGWDLFGPERTVTRSEGNVLYELDGKPALALYKRYLGDRADGLPATGLLFPLAVRRDAGDDQQVVRTILGVDEEQQSMTFAGDLPQGARVRLMRANFDRLIGGAAAAAECLGDAGSPAATLAIAISCVGRRLVLGERTEEEVEATLAGMPAGTQQVGFYSYGEISPHTDGTCDLHNQTMTLTTISEE